jgi:hypothetical protein
MQTERNNAEYGEQCEEVAKNTNKLRPREPTQFANRENLANRHLWLLGHPKQGSIHPKVNEFGAQLHAR